MARKRKIDRDMARAVAFDRLAAKADKNNDHTGWLNFTRKSIELKARARERMARQAVIDKERKLFEADLKKLGMKGALDAAKTRREEKEKSDG